MERLSQKDRGCRSPALRLPRAGDADLITRITGSFNILCSRIAAKHSRCRSECAARRDGDDGTLTTPPPLVPAVRGVPRFVRPSGTLRASLQWAAAALQFESENVGRRWRGTGAEWERITGVYDYSRRQADRRVRCGPGRFLDVVRSRGYRRRHDLSGAVTRPAQLADDPDVLIVQGDRSTPPFPGVFAAGSRSASSTTPHPAAGRRRGADASARCLAACCVYPRGDFHDFASVHRGGKSPAAEGHLRLPLRLASRLRSVVWRRCSSPRDGKS